MYSAGVLGVGLSVQAGANDLSTFAGQLDHAETLGLDAVEIPLIHLDVVVGGRIRAPALAELQRICAGRPFRYTVHGPIGLNFMDEPFRLPLHAQVLDASLEVTAAIGGLHYVVHAGFAPPMQARGLEERLAVEREYLHKAGDRAAALKVFLCVENIFDMRGLVTASPSGLARQLAKVGHPHVSATMDVSHGHIQCASHGLDPIIELGALAPFARHVHLHDSFGRPDDLWTYSASEALAFGSGDLHLPLGWGSIDWDGLMAQLTFPEGVVFNIELNDRYWAELGSTIAEAKRLAGLARTERASLAA